MLSVYLDFAAVIWPVFDIQHLKGPQYMPPISVTMRCEVSLITHFSFATSSFGSRSHLMAVRWFVMLSVYLGITAVIWSVFDIKHPKGAQYTPPISVTMQCVINLTVQFFIVYLALCGHPGNPTGGLSMRIFFQFHA